MCHSRSARRKFVAVAAAAVAIAGLPLGSAPAASGNAIEAAEPGPSFVMPPGDHTLPARPGSQGKEMPAPGIPGGIERLRRIKEKGQQPPPNTNSDYK